MVKATRQLDLFTTGPTHTLEELRERLSAESGRRISLTFTRNRVRMISLEFRSRDHVDIRLHEDFRYAPPDVLDALCRYLHEPDDEIWKAVANFAQLLPLQRPSSSPRRGPLRRKGKHYDLGEIYSRINDRFFSGNVNCRIGWARGEHRGRRRRRRQSVRYGTFHDETQTVRVNPLLDRPDVPVEFLEYIIFHEMLHAIVPSIRENGRCFHHPPAFRRLEQAFPDLDRMKRLCQTLIEKLD